MVKEATVEQATVTRPHAELNALRGKLAAERRRCAVLKMRVVVCGARYKAALACAKAVENWHDVRHSIT